jgi:hypothetical protein
MRPHFAIRVGSFGEYDIGGTYGRPGGEGDAVDGAAEGTGARGLRRDEEGRSSMRSLAEEGATKKPYLGRVYVTLKD